MLVPHLLQLKRLEVVRLELDLVRLSILLLLRERLLDLSQVQKLLGEFWFPAQNRKKTTTRE